MKPTLDTLKNELLLSRKELKKSLKHSYRAVRKDVREHPEKGLLIALASGLFLGYLAHKVVSDK
ncbi:hypothetical protein EP331_12520 [bacterium]|nr:MAG: hypothetical protein EP331_12520 [bacterium]